MKKLVTLLCVAAFALGMIGCTVDCEVCCEAMGVEACVTEPDVKKSECEDCGSEMGVEDVEGVKCTCEAK